MEGDNFQNFKNVVNINYILGRTSMDLIIYFINLQVICFIHFLESPLKHMLEFQDLGPGKNDTFITGGPIAMMIKNLKLKSFVKYQAMRDILIPAGK